MDSTRQTAAPLLLTVAEAAALTRIKRSMAYRLANTSWPVVRIGKAIRIPVAQLEDWIRDNCSSANDRQETLAQIGAEKA